MSWRLKPLFPAIRMLRGAGLHRERYRGYVNDELILRREKAMENEKSTYATVGPGLGAEPRKYAHYTCRH